MSSVVALVSSQNERFAPTKTILHVHAKIACSIVGFRAAMNQTAKTLLSVLMFLTLLPFGDAIASAQTASPDKPVGELSKSELDKRAEAGDAVAQNELGIRYRLGIDVEKDPAKAIPWFLKAAQQGNAKAYFNLGAAYYNGDGVAINDDESCVWFMLAADAGDATGRDAVERVRRDEKPYGIVRCEASTASAYLRGGSIKQDLGQALHWYIKAANDGSGLACERLAYLYSQGIGVQQDKEQSLKWLKRSADLGYLPAVFELGMAYETGTMVPQDLDKARKLYDKAAHSGQPDALIALGNLYAEGRGTKADQQKAFMYYTLAAAYGSTSGKRRAEELQKGLTHKQVIAAKQDAQRFLQSGPVLLQR
ncbi:MAG: SEL1-like repeat protein [Candidatus Korobacteraceae bacterium]